jgi:DNA-directed RNA polymerase subunit K/omega
MSVKTLDLKQLDETSEDIYEAVIKASRRAKEILNERNHEKQMMLENSTEDETVIVQTAEEREQELHPVDIAIEELLDSKLDIEYEKEKPF